MICSKCKKQVQGHKSICPHCNSLFIPEVENKPNVNAFNILVHSGTFVNAGFYIATGCIGSCPGDLQVKSTGVGIAINDLSGKKQTGNFF